MKLSHSANCGPPNQPLNGYIFPYLSTIEDTMVTILCWNDEQRSIRKKGNLTCNHHGVWEPNPSEVCGTELVSGNKIYTNIHYNLCNNLLALESRLSMYKFVQAANQITLFNMFMQVMQIH